MIEFEGYLFSKEQIAAIGPAGPTPNAHGGTHHFNVFLAGINDTLKFRFQNLAQANDARDRLHGLTNNP